MPFWARNPGRRLGGAGDVRECDVVELRVFRVIGVDATELAALYREIVEPDIPEIDTVLLGGPTRDDVHRRARVVDHDVGERRVVDAPVPHAQTDAVAARGERAVGHRHERAFGRGFPQPVAARSEGDAIVRRVDVAVGDRHVLAAVDVDAVAVVRMDGLTAVVDVEPPRPHLFATVEEAAPVRGVRELKVLHAHVSRFYEIEHLARPPRDFPLSARPVLSVGSHEKREGIAVDLPRPAHGHVLLLDTEEEVRAEGGFGGVPGILRTDVRRVVVRLVGTAQNRRARAHVEIHVALEEDGSGQIRPRRHFHRSAARGVRGVDRLLDSRRVLRHPVAFCAVVLHRIRRCRAGSRADERDSRHQSFHVPIPFLKAPCRHGWRR